MIMTRETIPLGLAKGGGMVTYYSFINQKKKKKPSTLTFFYFLCNTATEYNIHTFLTFFFIMDQIDPHKSLSPSKDQGSNPQQD